MAHVTAKHPTPTPSAAPPLLCFTAGTMIDTPSGERAVERLKVGDLVWTADNGPMAVRWLHQRRFSRAELRADESLRPVVFAANALGKGTPERPLRVSPLHRICLKGWRSELFFGQNEVLVPARNLVNGDKITQPLPPEEVIYVHFLLDGHQIVRSNGLMSESFHPSAEVINQMDARTRQELLWLFPDALDADGRFAKAARQTVTENASRLVA